MTQKNIEITIPVLNEEETLLAQIETIIQYLSVNDVAPGYSLSLVIADNGSTDGTQDIAVDLAKKYTCVKYIRLEERGVGRALKASWTQSCADIVGYMDLDLATDLKHLKVAFASFDNGSELVTGSRLARGAKVIGRTPLRSFTSRVFNLIVQTWFGSSFSDGMCGFKFLKRNILASLMAGGAKSDGWFFATELLVVADALKLSIKDLPVEWTDDPNSKVKITKLTVEYLKAMKRLKAELKEKELA
ncbi:glycosyltransferase [Marinagarivorans algicola]|uniref:glycosyltransferase n=1 Tax=Marinagarivorans algicola TaxID=1513270 RepID=UPI0006B9BAA1|nr:glycosyltransferase [Marinagarivorans algicola]